MVGAAERAILSRERTIVEHLRSVAAWPRPPYAGASAFRFVYDRSASRDVADTSAVAQHLGVMVRAMIEQPYYPPPGPDPGAIRADAERTSSLDPLTLSEQGLGTSEPEETVLPPDGPRTGDGSTLVLQTTRALLAVPATVASHERARQGCVALSNGWYVEAERLFMAGVGLTPTDPFVWFGAGLAASRVDKGRAAEHLTQAARYLAADDPPGSAYASILAAGLLETAGDVAGATTLLLEALAELNMLCPAISLHLARLGHEADDRLVEAVQADPMVGADLVAAGRSLSQGAARQRFERTQREIGLIEYSITELQLVDGGARPHPAASADEPADAPDLDPLGLVAQEVELWKRMKACENEIEFAQAVVDDRVRQREAKEAEVAEARALAESDLVYRTALPTFLLSVFIAVMMVAVFVVGRSLGSRSPSVGLLVGFMVFAVEIALLYTAGRLLYRAWWPHRRFVQAREAKQYLPILEWEATERRQREFEVKRRCDQASQAAELRIRRIIDRREFLIPRRPSLASSQMPPAPSESGQPE